VLAGWAVPGELELKMAVLIPLTRPLITFPERSWIMRLVSTAEAWLGTAFVPDSDLATLSRDPPSGPVIVMARAAELFVIKFGDEN
jgi:hypothetical protein